MSRDILYDARDRFFVCFFSVKRFPLHRFPFILMMIVKTFQTLKNTHTHQ